MGNMTKKQRARWQRRTIFSLLFLIAAAALYLYFQKNAPMGSTLTLSEVPAYDGHPYVEVHGNLPDFTAADLTANSYELYGYPDLLGRCTACVSCIGRDLMPNGDRQDISTVHPTGWVQAKYDFVDGGLLYNRCHLIGYQLTGENANEHNLITGTRYLNIEGMLPFENMVADYIKETGNHVLYRVTPLYDGMDLVAQGVQMEGQSIEDRGEAVCFNVFCYNVQPGVEIDYATGESKAAS